MEIDSQGLLIDCIGKMKKKKREKMINFFKLIAPW